MIQTYAYHSFLPKLLRGFPVLDVGSRDFRFAEHFACMGHQVIALDPDPEVKAPAPEIPNILFRRQALVGFMPGLRELVVTSNPEARYVAPPGETFKPSDCPRIPIAAITFAELIAELGINEWDLVKLNCEGEESHILANWPGPYARQIVVSFHEHYRPIGRARIDEIIAGLGNWYDVAQNPWDERYYGGFNYWDTLLSRKQEYGP